jgi:nucleoid-associated protein YgaU
LWSITASLLGSSATNAQIARAWPEVFDLNRSVIGADPNLLLPGQTLQIPASLGSVAR